ncbi:hypothetical protein BHK69_30760 (plasmid) [Bosea vaviloviae]|uniref:DUF6035 domain-containing protein n=1 Tax=Bosea vaviloviae TaxID=1526658 RepID=A0A1D7UCT0_9HYPH|nr:hypothetical protein BHK69_30760 [Bosea vaviloviae]
MREREDKPKRIIEAALFEGNIGPVTARELVAMPSAEWGMLRDRITDYRQGRPVGLLCRCAMCGDPVFIRARKKNNVPLPLFSHFQGGGLHCPWHSGSNADPNELREAQYQGKQESQAHRLLCEQIEAMAKLDERYLASSVNAYRPPTESEYGRFPDVAVTWRDFPECVFEVQLSRTFQTEISARCTHYEREGVALVWVLFGFDPQHDAVPQNFIDVIRRHRGNAFIIDRDSVAAAHDQRTLVLKCYPQNAHGRFDPPRLVRLDELVFPKDSLPYMEDRISKALFERIDAARRPCFAFLKTINGVGYGVERDSEERDALISALRAIAPQLSYWESARENEENAVLRLVACVFSLIAEANGKRRIYGTKQPNVVAMLNTWLHTREDIQRCALIFEYLLQRSPLTHLLAATLGEHIARAKGIMEGNLVLEHEPEWSVLSHLVPEIFHPLIRDELRYLSALPPWAQSIDGVS